MQCLEGNIHRLAANTNYSFVIEAADDTFLREWIIRRQ